MINVAGFKVWPAEVEMSLYTHPDIQEVAVVSTPDARRGETVKAFVALKPQARGQVSGDQIIEWARGRLAAYKVPRWSSSSTRCRAAGPGRSSGARCRSGSGSAGVRAG